MHIKPKSSQETKDNPFEFSEHGAYLCATQFWTFVRAQRCFTVISVQPHEAHCFIASADKQNKY